MLKIVARVGSICPEVEVPSSPFHVYAVSKDLFVQIVGHECSADKTGGLVDLAY